MSNKIISNGGFVPSSIDTPLDLRTRIESVDDIYNIDQPYVGMIVYVIDEDKYYKVKTLKAKEVGNALIENSLVDAFEEVFKPEFEGTLSLNRKADTEIGERSSTLGTNCIASGNFSHAEGNWTISSGGGSHAEGRKTEASGGGSHAEGNQTIASGDTSHAEGNFTVANGDFSHAEGNHTVVHGESQHVQGKYNIPDTGKEYAHIVGNGNATTPSNAHTLDWNGNAWFQGDVFIKGTCQDDAQKLATEDTVIALQQEVAELRAIIDELKVTPPEEYLPSEISGLRYVIANENIESEMSNMQSHISDKEVIGFVINALLYKTKKSFDENDMYDNYGDYFFEFEISLKNNINFGSTKNTISHYKNVFINLYSSSLNIDFTIDLSKYFEDKSYGKVTAQLDSKTDPSFNSTAYGQLRKLFEEYDYISDPNLLLSDLMLNMDIILIPYVNYGGELDGYYRAVELQKHSTCLNNIRYNKN